MFTDQIKEFVTCSKYLTCGYSNTTFVSSRFSVLFSAWKGNCETFPWKTSHFMSSNRLKLQETPFPMAVLTIFYKSTPDMQTFAILQLVLVGRSQSQ